MCDISPWCGSCDLRLGKDAPVSDGIILTAGMPVCAMCKLSLTAVDGTFSLSVKSCSRVQDHRASCKVREEKQTCPGLSLLSELHQKILFLFSSATSIFELLFHFFCWSAEAFWGIVET